jgi:L-threonylcarbamoyladenylate synthase
MPGLIADLIATVQAGGVISFPTDTLPALATKPDQAGLIYQLKQRSSTKPLILMAAHSIDLWDFVQGSSTELATWQQLAGQYWPGALTLVLPASELLPIAMNPTGEKTIGVRVPDCDVAQLILQETGPLATTSANLTGQPALLTMAEIDRQFPTVQTLAMDSELSLAGIPSTVIQWTQRGWQILRPGSISF